jgi:hypothetical protein
MPSLRELQTGLVTSLRAPPSAALLAAVQGDGLAPAERLAIYANHFRLSLVAALATTFPVVRTLLGEACFAQCAGAFACRHPPRTPCVFAYGARLPAFLAAQPQLAGLPWLADVARLEWALNEARHAPDAAPVRGGRARLAAAPTARLVVTLAPCVRFFASRWPVDQIWRAHVRGELAAPLVLEDRDASLVVLRDADDEVGWLPLPRAEFAFVRAIARGRSVGCAGAVAASTDPGFNPIPLLQALLSLGVVTDVAIHPRTERSSS